MSSPGAACFWRSFRPSVACCFGVAKNAFWRFAAPLVPDIIPVYFISFLRLATEQHSTLPQKGGINGKVYLLNKMNNFTSSRPTLWLKSSRNCSGGWRGLVGGFSYYIKIFYQIYCIKIYEKGENLKVRSTEEYWCQFGFIHWPFFRGRRQGRQPLNKIW